MVRSGEFLLGLVGPVGPVGLVGLCGSVESRCRELSENVWLVWSKTSYSGDKWRCHRCGTNKQQVKIGLLSF